jgi:uncharacterized membrane protein
MIVDIITTWQYIGVIKMNQYLPMNISQAAVRLYRSTQTTVVLYTIAGVLLGLAASFFTGQGFDMRAIPGAVILGALGYTIGSYRAPSN